jgi:hypothetical protein
LATILIFELLTFKQGSLFLHARKLGVETLLMRIFRTCDAQLRSKVFLRM